MNTAGLQSGRSKSEGRMRTLRWVGLAWLIAATGCGRQDAEKLARVGWKLAEKFQRLVPEPFPFGGMSLAADPSLEGRVRARIRADKFLAPQNIEVLATAGGVRLRGTVDDPVLKRRAVEMAESTVGVEKVVDELTIP